MNTPDVHPGWCGRGHVCSHDRPVGEHRSHPVTFDSNAARLVATRIRTRAGRDRIEIRAVLDLPADPHAARTVARLLVVRLFHILAVIQTHGGMR